MFNCSMLKCDSDLAFMAISPAEHLLSQAGAGGPDTVATLLILSTAGGVWSRGGLRVLAGHLDTPRARLINT